MVGPIRAQIPIDRFGRAEEIAATGLHLASPESAFIVGAAIIADGGMNGLVDRTSKAEQSYHGS